MTSPPTAPSMVACIAVKISVRWSGLNGEVLIKPIALVASVISGAAMRPNCRLRFVICVRLMVSRVSSLDPAAMDALTNAIDARSAPSM